MNNIMRASENEDLLFCNKYKYQLSNGFLVTNESYNNIYEWDKVMNIINALVNKKLNLSNGCLYIYAGIHVHCQMNF